MHALIADRIRPLGNRRIVWSLVVVWTTGCGGSTNVGQRAVSDDGGGATSAGGGAGVGGASTGGLRGSGGNASGGSAPGGSGGAVIASGGAGGQQDLCFGSDGRIRPELKNCSSDSDCKTFQIATCCGSDQVVGIKQGSSCTLPAIDCSGLGCAKFQYPMAEDRSTTESGGSIAVRCEASDSGKGTCRSYVVAPVDGGTKTPCGAQTCGENQVCALPPNNGPPPQGAPYCVDIPPTCSNALACSCFAPDVCGGGAKFCYSIAGHEMQCLFAP